MQTSVESEAPGPAFLRSISNESVHIDREVSVVSSRAPTPSIIPSTVNEHVPVELVPGVISVMGPGTKLNRWNSKISDKSWRHSRGTSSQARRGSQDPSLLDNNRESMKALTDFLMTREPPPNNFMSVPSDDEKSIKQLKRTAFRLFGKHKKQVKSPRLLQLPDSAVAAHTRSGARHIAISIPMQHDHPQGPSGPQGPSNSLRSYQTARPDSRGAVTVLKSVAEVRESASWYHASDQKSSSDPVDSEKRPISPMFPLLPDGPGVDAAQILNAYHSDSILSHKQPRVEPALSTRFEPQTSQRSYFAVSPIEIHRQDSQRTDPRYSDGTAYSQVSFAITPRGHSRQVSSVSTAPSAPLISPLKLDLPPRSSSIFKVPKAIQEELACASKITNENAAEKPPISPATKSCESVGTSPSPPAVFGIAVRGYDASPVGRPQVVRNPTLKSQPHISTSKQLPNPPESESGFIPRPLTAPPFRTRNLTVSKSQEGNVRRATSSRDGTEESILVTRQSRQERVRARKLRDIESLRSQSGGCPPLSEFRGTNISCDPTQNQAYITAPPPRNSKRGVTNSKEAPVNTLTPIMLVANLHPYTGHASKSDLPLGIHRKEKAKTYSPESTIRSTYTHTPPRSILTSFASDSDVPLPTSSTSKRRSTTQSLRSSVLETRRQERRAKRNMSLREKEMEARMSKIENDNIMLLQTLGGIARSFGEISRIGKETRGAKERRGGKLLDDVWRPSAENKRVGERERMEPVMRELQVLAPTVDRESCKFREEVEEYDDEEEEEDGMSILG